MIFIIFIWVGYEGNYRSYSPDTMLALVRGMKLDPANITSPLDDNPTLAEAMRGVMEPRPNMQLITRQRTGFHLPYLWVSLCQLLVISFD